MSEAGIGRSLPETELRRAFHDRLAGVRRRVERMAADVQVSLERVTDALLLADAAVAQSIVAADAHVDAAFAWVEGEVFEIVARESPVARDLRMVIASLRVAQEIERSGDLVASIARRAPRLDPTALSGPVRLLLTQMGHEASSMFSAAAGCYATLDADRARTLRRLDDRMDDLHRRLLLELFGANQSPEPMIELGLIARFYERVADHAVVIAERVRFVVSGRMRAVDADESSG